MRVGRWHIGRVEERASYGEDVAQELLRQAGTAPADREALAVVQAAAGVWSRSFAAAETDIPELTPSVLARIGRLLLLRGEASFVIDVIGGRVLLTPCEVEEVEGDFDPLTWRYKVEYEIPSTAGTKVRSRKVNASGVVHVRVNESPPWRGHSPLAAAGLTSDLAAAVEQMMSREAKSDAVGYVLPHPRGPGETGMTTLATALGSLRGRLHLVETTQSGAGGGMSRRPLGDWEQRRLGMDPPPVLRELRMDSAASLLQASGVPLDLVLPSSAGAQREAYRRFLALAVEPTARIAEAELSAKLDRPVRLTFARLQAADVAGRARAYRSLVGTDANMDAAEAAKKVGFE